ncbi:hypothetical protein [Erwinia psidii]|nr:hypothetical protein [Erwinia psidii]
MEKIFTEGIHGWVIPDADLIQIKPARFFRSQYLPFSHYQVAAT